VSNLVHSTEWQSRLTEIRQVTKQPLGVGTQFAFVRTFLGRKLEANNEITEFSPYTTVAFKTISGPIPAEPAYHFEPVGNVMKLTSKIKMQPEGFFSIAEPLISASLERDMKTGVKVLKDMLGSQVTVTAPLANP